MSGADFSVALDDVGVVAKIRALRAAAEDLAPLHKRIGAAMVSNIQLGFKNGKSPFGAAWAKPKYRDGEPLRDTGILRNSITSKADGDGVTTGTNVIYAAVHQFGAKSGEFGFGVYLTRLGSFPIPWGDIPARPFMPLDASGNVSLPPSYEKTIITRIRAHFTKAGS